MSSDEYLREFVKKRLTAADEAFRKIIIENGEGIDRLLEIVWKPELKLHRIDHPQRHVCKEEEEEVPAAQQLCKQEMNSSMDQEDPEPPHVKEEQEELHISQEGEQLVLNQETHIFTLTPSDEEYYHSEDQALYMKPEENAAQEESGPTHFRNTDRKGAAGTPKPASRLATKKAAFVLQAVPAPVDQTRGRCQCSQLLHERNLELAAANQRVAQLDAERQQLAELNAEVAALKEINHKLREENQREREARLKEKEEWQRQLGEEVSVQLQAALETRDGTASSTPDRTPPHTPTQTPAAASFVSPHVPGHSVFSTFSRQHADIVLRELRPEDYAILSQMSQGRMDRYGCLLFRSVITEEDYRAWCANTNWDGSRGKWELPRNLKEFLITTLKQQFPNITPGEEKMFVSRINEVLRTPRQFVCARLGVL